MPYSSRISPTDSFEEAENEIEKIRRVENASEDVLLFIDPEELGRS